MFKPTRGRAATEGGSATCFTLTAMRGIAISIVWVCARVRTPSRRAFLLDVSVLGAGVIGAEVFRSELLLVDLVKPFLEFVARRLARTSDFSCSASRTLATCSSSWRT